MNQVPKGENKDISPITLASYVTDAPPPGSSHTGNLPGLIPSGTLSTESSSHGPFLINPLATDPIQKETIRRASYAWKLNYVFNVPTDDIDSNSSPIHSPDENDARGALVDNRDLLIALFSYASSLPPSGSFPPKPFPPESFLSGSLSKESPAKKISRNPHDSISERGKEGSSLHSKPMSPMIAIVDSQVVSNESRLTAVKWACGSIALCLLMLTSKLISSYRSRCSQTRVFNQIKNFHFVDMILNRFMIKRRGSNMNRVIFPRWKAG